jgi:hypothetical protein
MIMNDALISEKMEIKDNTFARQFETLVDGKLISVEYSFQEKKIFTSQKGHFSNFWTQKTNHAKNNSK